MIFKPTWDQSRETDAGLQPEIRMLQRNGASIPQKKLVMHLYLRSNHMVL